MSFVSQSSFDSFPKVFLRLFSKKCEVITNGVDLERVNQFIRNQKFTNSHNKEDKVRLVYIGKFYLQKNHDLVLEVLKSLPGKYVLTLVGDGPKEFESKRRRKAKHLRENYIYGSDKKVCMKSCVNRMYFAQLCGKACLMVSWKAWLVPFQWFFLIYLPIKRSIPVRIFH